MPELEHFESDEKRDIALTQAGKKFNRFYGWGTLYVCCASALASIVAVYVIQWIGLFAPWVGQIRWIVTFLIMYPFMMIAIRWFNRRSFSILLREKLIEQGVPMCLKCGYNLRGQPADSTRCPECGTGINEASRQILAKQPGS